MPPLAMQLEAVAAEYPLYGSDAVPSLSPVVAIDPLIEAARLLLWHSVPSNRRPRNPDLSIAVEEDELFLRRVRTSGPFA